MPQNIRTRSVLLRQEQYEQTRDFPKYQGLKGSKRRLFERYSVASVRLKDGRQYEGLLLWDDRLLVPESDADWDSSEIIEITATPPDEHPDFSITEPDSLYERGGIEMTNAWRIDLFHVGEEKDKSDPRSIPRDIAHEDALYVDSSVHVYPGEIPATYYGVSDVTLTAEGVKIGYRSVSRDAHESVLLWPKSSALWTEILGHEFTIEEGFTLGSMLTLLDLPADVARQVYLRTMPYPEKGGFRPWLEAQASRSSPFEGEMEAIVVQTYMEESDGSYRIFRDSYGLGFPLTEHDENTGMQPGDRVQYALSYSSAARYRHIPLRYNPDLVVPHSHEVYMEFARGTLLDWRQGGEVGPRPEPPVLLRLKATITLGQFIGALFRELGTEDMSFEDEQEHAELPANGDTRNEK